MQFALSVCHPEALDIHGLLQINIVLKNFLFFKADGELMEDVTLDDLKDELPEHQPRFVLYTFPYTHADERISYPLCLIFSSPRESKTELMVMYAGSKLELEKRAEVHKVYEVCDLDDLSLDLIKEKLAK